jgi:bifunctional non-homologous end joining protein LigD
MIEKACGMDLEGIVSKKIDSPYVSRRDPTWVKSKCTNRQEFVIIGYTDPKGARSGFGSILLGYHDDGRLVYGGRAGTGFDDKGLAQLMAQLREIEVEKPPTDVAPPARERRQAHWVEPKLVAEIRFTNWTRDGVLRHPVFVALRTDKPEGEIVREKAMPVKKIKSQMDAHSGNGRERTKGATAGEKTTSGKAEVAFEGVRLTHPDKVLFAEQGVTKRLLAEYYAAVAEWMLPHVVDRPLALVRCPEGMAGKCFFQRNWSETMPAAVGKVTVGEGKKKEQHVTAHDLSGVISLVQMSALEIHAWNCTTKDVNHPDQLIFDLDPGPDVPWKRVVEGAKKLETMLDGLKLPTFLKTSGGKGLHVTVPIQPNIDWESGKSFCQTIANALVEQGDWFVANMRKDLRGGKIYIDYNRNDHFATAVAPYSSRAREGAAVSMPISWDELERVKSASQFTVETAAKYVAKRKKDPWGAFERARVDLKKFVRRK